MTIASTTTKVLYNGDGATTQFAISFVFWQSSDIRVIHRDVNGVETVWTEGSHYTISGGKGATGTLAVITVPTDHTPAAGERLLIKSDIAELQQAALPLGGAFPSTTVEQMVDIVTRLVQQKTEEIARSILLPETATLSGLQLPEPGAGEVIRYNSLGTGLETVKLATLSPNVDTLLTQEAEGDRLEYSAASTAWVNKPGNFVVSAQAMPNMTVRVSAGTLYDMVGTARVSRTGQTSATISPPTMNARHDIVHVDQLTGVIGITSGSEAADPSDPTLGNGQLPLARINLTPATTRITAAEITDIRELAGIGQAKYGAGARQVALNDQDFVDVASMTTTNIGSAASSNLRIIGTTTIAGFDTVAAGLKRYLRFATALTLVHNGTSLILPGAADIVTAADDTAEFISLGSGNWLCLSYKRASGTALLPPFKRLSSIEVIRKTADQTVNNSTALQNDNELFASLAANENVYFEAYVIQSSNAAADIKLGFVVPIGASLNWNALNGILVSVSGATQAFADVSTRGGTHSISGSVSSEDRQVYLVGHVANGPSAGNLQLQWTQNTADASNTTVRAHSRLIVWRE